MGPCYIQILTVIFFCFDSFKKKKKVFLLTGCLVWCWGFNYCPSTKAICSLVLFLRTSLFWGICCWNRRGLDCFFSGCCCVSTCHLIIRMLGLGRCFHVWLYVHTGGLQWSPYVCRASALPTEPSPEPPYAFPGRIYMGWCIQFIVWNNEFLFCIWNIYVLSLCVN